MSDTYQAVYDAVSNRIGRPDWDGAITRALDFSIVQQRMHEAVGIIECEQTRPSVLYKPSIKIDGAAWCALYGENIQDGVAGFGASPAEAMRDFDANWQKQIAA